MYGAAIVKICLNDITSMAHGKTNIFLKSPMFQVLFMFTFTIRYSNKKMVLF